nr:hypothetical protein Iba_chr04bCG20560 [Ipomoea batatas]
MLVNISSNNNLELQMQLIVSFTIPKASESTDLHNVSTYFCVSWKVSSIEDIELAISVKRMISFLDGSLTEFPLHCLHHLLAAELQRKQLLLPSKTTTSLPFGTQSVVLLPSSSLAKE